MSINSIQNSCADLFNAIAEGQAKEIKQAVILGQLNMELVIASQNAESILSSLDGWEMDDVIPEDSTVSFHV